MKRVVALVLGLVVVAALVVGAAISSLTSSSKAPVAALLAAGCAASAQQVSAAAVPGGQGLPPAASGGSGAGALSAAQMDVVRTIVDVGQRLGVPRRGAVVAVATGRQESELTNINYGDRDSLGVFQQRAPWGSVADRTDVAKSTALFYTSHRGQGLNGLLFIPGWESMPVWKAAQSVQISAFPGAYAKWESLAESAVASVEAERGPYTPAAVSGPPASAPADPAAPSAEKVPTQTTSCSPPVVSTPGAVDGASVAYTGPPGAWTQPMPPGSYAITSVYGMRTNPVSGIYKLHGGTDLSAFARCGAPIRAASAGVVTKTVQDSSFGNLTVIDNGGGIETYYAHQVRFGITQGATVATGQPIGFEGTSGNSTGCHLHFEVHVQGARTNPQPFMAAHGAPLG